MSRPDHDCSKMAHSAREWMPNTVSALFLIDVISSGTWKRGQKWPSMRRRRTARPTVVRSNPGPHRHAWKLELVPPTPTKTHSAWRWIGGQVPMSISNYPRLELASCKDVLK